MTSCYCGNPACDSSCADEKLVCPNCASDRIGTIERADIWQPARFTRADTEAVAEDEQGRGIAIEWDAYDSDDVGDTETVGYFCRACLWTHHGDGDSAPTFVPFIPASEVTTGA